MLHPAWPDKGAALNRPIHHTPSHLIAQTTRQGCTPTRCGSGRYASLSSTNTQCMWRPPPPVPPMFVLRPSLYINAFPPRPPLSCSPSFPHPHSLAHYRPRLFSRFHSLTQRKPPNPQLANHRSFES
ncbi:hypothetical protein LX36DRAFT_161605 [Colletotrichum falcatum]|nr:hypothetical protein LX36DRAFT_161605 [Colletotrichum falcatum]